MLVRTSVGSVHDRYLYFYFSVNHVGPCLLSGTFVKPNERERGVEEEGLRRFQVNKSQ